MLELQLRVSKGKASQIKAHILWIFLVCWDPWNLLGIDRLGSGKNDRFRKNKTPFLRCHVMIFFVTISHRNAVKFKWCAICTEKEHVKMRQGRNRMGLVTAFCDRICSLVLPTSVHRMLAIIMFGTWWLSQPTL